jgi:elongation factor G
VEIEAPETFTGAIMGDLTGRRGRVQGMGGGRGTTVIRAEVPMAEMLSYGPALTSLTQGLGSFHMEMTRYDVVPQAVADKVIAAAHKPVQADEDA